MVRRLEPKERAEVEPILGEAIELENRLSRRQARAIGQRERRYSPRTVPFDGEAAIR